MVTFVTATPTASLVFSSAAITAGEEYTVYTGGTVGAIAGLGEGALAVQRPAGGDGIASVLPAGSPLTPAGSPADSPGG